MKTTTILSIVAIVAAVAAAGLVTTISFSTPAHAGACVSQFNSPGQPKSDTSCGHSSSGSTTNNLFHNH